MATELEDRTDSMIISLMDDMKALSLQSKDLSEGKSFGTSSNLDDMKIVLQFYDNIIEQLSKIAENIAKTSALEEKDAGTLYMGSSGDGTYLPEFSDSFDAYLIEEDTQCETGDDLEAVDADFESKNPSHSRLLKVCY